MGTPSDHSDDGNATA